MSNRTLNFIEEEVEIKGEELLKGTITIPNSDLEKYPAIIIVSGSGEIDRDGTILTLDLETNIYKELAKMITNLGFITLRYDKRGIGESSGTLNKTGMWDLVDDVEKSIEFLRSHPRVDSSRLILMGHSEGCTLITAAYQRKPVEGLILLSGAAEPMQEATKRQREIIYEQLMSRKGFIGFMYRLAKINKKGEKQARKLNDKVLNTSEDTIEFGGQTINAKWLREHYLYDVKADLKNITCPVFAATGTKDFQANPENLNTLPRLVKGEVEIRAIEDMDHSLKEYHGPIDAINFKQNYKDNAEKPIHKELQKLLIDWLVKHFK